jgi:methyl-accepting chemotaxis protein
VLHLIERTGSQSVPADIVGHIICGLSTLVLKTQHTLYLSTVSDALNVARTETKAKAENTAQTLDHIKQELQSTVDIAQQFAMNVQKSGNTAEEARAAAKEAIEVGRATVEMARETRNKRLQEHGRGGR